MNALSLANTDETAPTNTRRAAAVAMALPIDKVPRYGTRAWTREEGILYRGARSFRCNVCKLVAHEDDGGADDMPDACSTCWCAAHPKGAEVPS